MLGVVLELLRRMTPHIHGLQTNECGLYKMLVNENPVDYETKEIIVNKNRIINRLRVNKMSEAINKICELGREKLMSDSEKEMMEGFIETDIS
jgi:hypothetical protein